MSALQLAIDHDDDGVTFDKYDPTRFGNSFPSVRRVASGGSVGSEEPPSHIKGPPFEIKDPRHLLKLKVHCFT